MTQITPVLLTGLTRQSENATLAEVTEILQLIGILSGNQELCFFC